MHPSRKTASLYTAAYKLSCELVRMLKLECVIVRTALHFVRCVKPNAAQVPSTFDASLVLHQLRCCGVLEVTRIARAGYPTRYLHQEFADRYGILLTPKARGDPDPYL